MRSVAQWQLSDQQPASSTHASSPRTRGLQHDLIMQGQRTIGNDALQRMLQAHAEGHDGLGGEAPLRSGQDLPATVQRSAGNQTKAANPRASTRPGAAWPLGPITDSKSREHDLTTYLRWVKEVEHAYGSDSQAVLQRLRRLYYSAYGGPLGEQFDAVIAEQGGADGVPLNSLMISFEALDGLYETGTVRTPTGDVIDVSHLLAVLDVKTAGASGRAMAAEPIFDVRMSGVLSWTGDLAWWFVQWVEKRHELDATPSTEPATEAGPPNELGGGWPVADFALLNELANTKASQDDLLGDMDGTVLAEENVRRSTVESVRAQGRPIRNRNVDTELSMPVSSLLEQYYFGTGVGKPARSHQRFQNFVRRASPPIPHTTTSTGAVVLSADAEMAIYTAIGNTARLFLSRLTPDASDPLTRHQPILREIARRFARFLETGLAKGNAPWP
jgi:hypothetical protein